MDSVKLYIESIFFSIKSIALFIFCSVDLYSFNVSALCLSRYSVLFCHGKTLYGPLFCLGLISNGFNPSPMLPIMFCITSLSKDSFLFLISFSKFMPSVLFLRIMLFMSLWYLRFIDWTSLLKILLYTLSVLRMCVIY